MKPYIKPSIKSIKISTEGLLLQGSLLGVTNDNADEEEEIL